MLKRFVAAFMLLLVGTAYGATDDAEPIRIGMIDALSGASAQTSEAMVRNLQFAIEQVNRRGGVSLPEGKFMLALSTFDNRQSIDETMVEFRRLTEQKSSFLVHGSSSAVAATLIDTVNRHNERSPEQRVLFLNYSAIDPSLTNEKCSYWHFRFDANADMRMQALTEAIRDDRKIKRIYLMGQDDAAGQRIAKTARAQLAAKRPDIAIVGDELLAIGKNRSFGAYIAKIKSSGADALIAGNTGNDLALLMKAANAAHLNIKVYKFHGNDLNTLASIGDAGVGRIRALSEWHRNVGGSAKNKSGDQFYAAYRQRYSQPQQDQVYLRMHLMVEMLVAAIEKAQTTEAAAVAQALEGARYKNGFHQATMRATDHQLLQPMYISVMQKTGNGGARLDHEGSGYGFKTERYLPESASALPTTCQMQRPAP